MPYEKTKSLTKITKAIRDGLPVVALCEGNHYQVARPQKWRVVHEAFGRNLVTIDGVFCFDEGTRSQTKEIRIYDNLREASEVLG